MTVFRALSAIHFTIYQSALAFIAAASVLHILLNFSWLNSIGYVLVMVGGYWLGQGAVNLINRALGYPKSSRSDSVD